MGYLVKRAAELVFSATYIILLTLLYGKKSIHGPFLCFGLGLNLNIRNGGKFFYGKVIVRRNLHIFCDGGTVSLGDGAFLNNNCSLNSMAGISIGDDTLFGENVKIYDHDHVINPDGTISKTQFHIAPVSIGRNCWIGSNATILKGVTICDGVVIGAGAVVAKSIDTPGVYVAKELAHLQKIS